MLLQLFIGSVLVPATLVVEATFITSAIRVLTQIGGWLIRPPHAPKSALALVGVTLWLLAAHSIGVWIWTGAFNGLGAFEALEPALYFSIVAFTTLSFGDITLSESWRPLSGMSAANGLIVFG